MRFLIRVILVMTLLGAGHATAAAQGTTTSSVTGTVADDTGAVLPGALVVVKNNATGTSLTTVSNTSGVFSVPSVYPGVYTVTISFDGFKSYVLSDLTVSLGGPASVRAVLSLGGVEETVQVSAAAQLLNTQTPTVSATLMGDQINKMPMTSRNLINAVAQLPGVDTASTVRNSTINGLSNAFVAITLDGINDNENLQKSSTGLFATLAPKQDSMEAVTVIAAGAGADVGGQGAVEVNFVTRSGTNTYDGSAYEYHRSAALNSNYWFNANAGLPKNEATIDQFGIRQGGPLVVPGVYDGHGKTFVFVNYERARQPSTSTRTRTLYNPATQAGVMQYNVTSGGTTKVQQVDMLALAASKGFNAAVDPTVGSVLNLIRQSTTTTGQVTQQTDPNLMSYTWLSPGVLIDDQTVIRIDHNLSQHNRLSGTLDYEVLTRDPDLQNNGDVRFPGGSNLSTYQAHRPLTSITLRSMLSSTLVNELRGGGRWSPSYFGLPDGVGVSTFDDTGGYSLAFGGGATGWTTTNAPSFRNAWNYQFNDTLTWQHGTHNITAGGELYYGNVTLYNQQTVPAIAFGVAANDPSNSLFTTANFPGASTAQLTSAAAIFGTLTGRVTGVNGQLVLDPTTNQYQPYIRRTLEGVLNQYSTFIQDAWRVTSGLTLSAGLRYQVQMPWSPTNSILSTATYADACGISGVNGSGTCNFFQPGAAGGQVPAFTQFAQGATGYKTDWNNFGPTVGFAWRPSVDHGFLRSILGDPDQAVVRGAFSIKYDQEGHSVFSDTYGANPGATLNISRTEANGLLAPGNTWPVYLTEASRLVLAEPCPTGSTTASCNPGSPSYPIAVRPGRADSLGIFDPSIQISSARTWSLSFGRALSKDTAIEVGYVGTRGLHLWPNQENYNERNVIENGFLNEFQTAMSNLQANIKAGCGTTGRPACSFAYRGPGTGTSPLPIYLAYFNGSKDATNPAVYAGNNWTNSTYVGRLGLLAPNVASAASDLDGTAALRSNALAAGLPSNFFVLNPDVNAVSVQTSNGSSTYDSLQIQLTRRLSKGLQLGGSYVYAVGEDSTYLGLHNGYALDPDAGVRHAFKFNWNYTLPVGHDERFGRDLPGWANGIIGGWSLNGVARFQAQMVDFGSVRLVNMTKDDLQKAYFYRINPDPANPGRQLVTVLPDDIIQNTRKAFSTSATTLTGYSDSLGAPDPNAQYIAPAQSANCITVVAGDCAPRDLLIRAPWFTRVDLSLAKRITVQGRKNVDLTLNVFNVFNAVNFNPVANPSGNATLFQVTSAFSDASNNYDPGGRLGELVVRFNW